MFIFIFLVLRHRCSITMSVRRSIIKHWPHLLYYIFLESLKSYNEYTNENVKISDLLANIYIFNYFSLMLSNSYCCATHGHNCPNFIKLCMSL